jgi:uncharacterized protein
MRTMRSLGLGLLTLTVSVALAEQSLSIATGGAGGAYYPYGGALAELIDHHIDGYSAVVEVTGASVENVWLIATGEADLALALADTVYQAYTGTGTGPLEGRTFNELRALLSIYPNAIHIVALAGAGITSLQDLRGRRVSVGAPGSGTEVSASTILEANGITYDDFTPERLNFNETAAALHDGQVDAGFWSVGPPTSSILDLAATRDIVLIPLSEEEIANAVEADPTFAPYTMSAGAYPGVDEAVPTISTPNVIIVHEDMDEELAYNVVRVIYENMDFIIERHPAAEDTTVEFAMEATLIPLHPGALRYFEEVGAEVPERLRGD